MNHDDVLNKLNEYLDGELSPAERKEMDAHFAVCSDCRRELEALRDLVGRAGDLPSSVQPGRDLWPGIEARLEDRSVITGDFGRKRRFSFWHSRTALAAAATVVLIILSVLGSLRPWEHETISSATEQVAVISTFARIDRASDRVSRNLLTRFDRHGNVVASEAGDVLNQNIGIIDGAIADIRSALQTDPTNTRLAQMLRLEYQRKMDLLRTVAELLGDDAEIGMNPTT